MTKLRNSRGNGGNLVAKELADPKYRQRREKTKKARLNKIIEKEVAKELREVKKSFNV